MSGNQPRPPKLGRKQRNYSSIQEFWNLLSHDISRTCPNCMASAKQFHYLLSNPHCTMEPPSSARPRKRTGRKVNGTRKNLKFPENYHLNVTTEKRVHAWYSSGIREAFASRDGGIVTTREAKDGSGILAIADSQIVLLHDARGHTHRRYKLKGKDVGADHLGHRLYSNCAAGPGQTNRLRQ